MVARLLLLSTLWPLNILLCLSFPKRLHQFTHLAATYKRAFRLHPVQCLEWSHLNVFSRPIDIKKWVSCRGTDLHFSTANDAEDRFIYFWPYVSCELSVSFPCFFYCVGCVLLTDFWGVLLVIQTEELISALHQWRNRVS